MVSCNGKDPHKTPWRPRGQEMEDKRSDAEKLADRLDDADSVFGFIGTQLERIADVLEAMEKRSRPSKTYGLFDD